MSGRRRTSFDFPLIFALLILASAVWSSVTWFFIPIAVFISLQSSVRLFRLAPIFAFTGLLLVFSQRPWTALDLLGLSLLFLEGGLLLHLKIRKLDYLNYIFVPLLVSAFAAILVFLSMSHGDLFQFNAWSEGQIRSEIFPYFFRPELWTDQILDVYQSLLAPIFRAGVFGWFGAVLGMAFFINSVFRNFIGRGLYGTRTMPDGKLWQHFYFWRSPDLVLIPLVVGLGLLVFAYQGDPTSSLKAILFPLGWNLSILAVFPILIHGVALASFLIPRVSMLFTIFIFVLLFMFPLPSLVLAGLLDLWFDFRSRMSSNPEDS